MKTAAPNNDDRTREFVGLLARHERRLYGYVVSLAPNWADADDILQNTKLRLWEQFDEYDPAKDFGAWACTIAHYMVLEQRKTSERRHARLSQLFVEAMSQEFATLAPAIDDRHIWLEQCLDQLTDDGRQMVLMCYSEDRSIREVAESLQRSVGGTQKAVFRLRRKLQECIEAKAAAEAARSPQ